MKIIKSALNLYLYSSIHIGLGALSLTLVNYLAFGFPIDMNYIIFAFSSTIFLYCLHRIIGIRKIKHLENKGRFRVISEYWYHILFYSMVSGTVSLFYFFKFDWGRWMILVAPSIFSLLYALPFFTKGKRLRDFPYIKLFLIALVWAWITAFIPLWENQLNQVLLWLIVLERFLYIIAITIPFDIRDRKIDSKSGVATIVHQLGVPKAYSLSKLLLIACFLFECTLFGLGYISIQYLLVFFITYFISWIVIDLSRNKSHDYYYSGLIDGTMILPGLMFYLLNLLN